MTRYYVNITEEELEDLNSVSVKLLSEDEDKLCIINEDKYQNLVDDFEEFRENTRTVIASEIGTVVDSLQQGEYTVEYANTSGAIKRTREGNESIGYDDIINLGLIKEDVSNKLTDEWNDEPSTTSYPSEKLVKDSLDEKVDKDKIIRGVNVNSDNDHIPTAKAVFEYSSQFVTPSELVDLIYPVGSIYMSVNETNPSSLLGGTWELIEDKFLLGKGSTFSTLGGTGGSATHTLTENEMPKHTHTQTAHTHSTHDGNFFLTSKDDISMNGTKRKIPASDSNGWYYIHDNSTNPKGIGENLKNGKGQKTVTDTVAKNNYTGGGQPHNNMPPYLVVNIWKRIG